MTYNLSEIKKLSIFDSLSDEDLKVVESLSTVRELEKDTVLLGGNASNVCVILSGLLQLLKSDNNGILWPIVLLSEGDMVGDVSFLGHSPTFSQMVAKEKTILLEMNRERLKKVVSENKSFSEGLYKILAVSLCRKLVRAGESIYSEARQVALSIRHEISSPLSLISLTALQMRDMNCGSGDEKKNFVKRLNVIVSAVDRISKILRDPSLMRGRVSVEPRDAVNVRTLIEETVELCSARFDKEGIQIDLENVPSHLFIECYSVQISQVILNLFNNGCDAVKELSERWIKVMAKDLGSQVEISVINSGPSIPTEMRKKIFQTFFTTKPPNHGTGLGLSISRKIVELHGGELELNESKENTRFDVRLPLGPRSYCSTLNPIGAKDVSGHRLVNKNSDNI